MATIRPNTTTILDCAHHLDNASWGRLLDRWDKLRAANVVGIIHKSSQGISYRDPQFNVRRKDCVSEGIPFAAYHFMDDGSKSNVVSQADNFIEACRGGGLRMFADYEADGLELMDLRKFMDRLEFKIGPSLRSGIYGGHLLHEQVSNNGFDAILARYPLWIAHYSSAADAPRYPRETWPRWKLWQYADSLTFEGELFNVDVNQYWGSVGEARSFFEPVDPFVAAVEDAPDAQEAA